MKTTHRFIHDTARQLPLDRESVDLIVTSPPYPMVAMWDECFSSWEPFIKDAFDKNDLVRAYELIHNIFEEGLFPNVGIYKQLFNVLKPGGIACINIGDAVRTLDTGFRIFSNHARVLTGMERAGFTPLPDILWRKQTNAPNKFMGSGMLPCGAYVTYEHEYILIFRKGNNRKYSAADKERRVKSAFFWEERNIWFSDIWDVKGARQSKDDGGRTGAFPLEIAFRLVNMYSLQGDTVLDPFGGTGTTALAALAAGRSSISVEIDEALVRRMPSRLVEGRVEAAERTKRRISEHLEFLEARKGKGKEALKHRSQAYGVPVVTAQERLLEFVVPNEVRTLVDGSLHAEYVKAELKSLPSV